MDEQQGAEQARAAGADERELRRRERRERVRARHPRIGWLLLALAGAQAYEESPPEGTRAHGHEGSEDSAEGIS